MRRLALSSPLSPPQWGEGRGEGPFLARCIAPHPGPLPTAVGRGDCSEEEA